MTWNEVWAVVACATAIVCAPAVIAGNEGDCCVANGSPGCNDEECEDIICSSDPFCCSTEWDENCADEASQLCEQCNFGCPGLGTCYTPNGTPGCDNTECCSAVCAIDVSCCSISWDQACVDNALQVCGSCGDAGAGNCCEPNGSAGCADAECCESVCAVDGFCCNTTWDSLCADTAQDVCSACATGACCIDGGCTVMPDTLCFASSGTYQGDGVACGAFTCGIPVFGACCLANGSCMGGSTSDCIAQGGTFQGVFTVCADVDCGPCPGDADGDGDCDSDDLNELLGDFGCTSSACSGDLDGSGTVDSVDLNILLGNFGCGV